MKCKSSVCRTQQLDVLLWYLECGCYGHAISERAQGNTDRCHLTSAQSCGSQQSAAPISLSAWGRTGTWSCSPLGVCQGRSHQFQLENWRKDTAKERSTLMFDVNFLIYLRHLKCNCHVKHHSCHWLEVVPNAPTCEHLNNIWCIQNKCSLNISRLEQMVIVGRWFIGWVQSSCNCETFFEIKKHPSNFL